MLEDYELEFAWEEYKKMLLILSQIDESKREEYLNLIAELKNL